MPIVAFPSELYLVICFAFCLAPNQIVVFPTFLQPTGFWVLPTKSRVPPMDQKKDGEMDWMMQEHVYMDYKDHH